MKHVIDGPADAPVLLLAHGIMTTHRMWDGVVAALAGRWRVLRYDLRGHGATPAMPPPYTMVQLAEDAVRLLDSLAIERAHFIGSSLGGMVGQQLGACFGQRLHTLTLANTTAVQGAPQAWADRMETAATKGVAPLVEPTLQRWFTDGFLAAGGEAVERMRALALTTSVDGFTGCAAAIRDLAQADLLARIRVPTLVIAGEHDSATSPVEAQFIRQWIPGAQLVMLPAAHQSAVECPQAFAAAWERFVLSVQIQGDKT